MALATLLGSSVPAHAAPHSTGQGTSVRHRIQYTSLTAAQYNPLGLQTDLLLGYRYRLFTSSSLLLRDTFAGAMLIARINPAFTRLGAGLEIQPLAALTLRALYEHRLYFGTANMLQSFASPYAEHDDDELRRRGKEGDNYAGHGHQITLQAVLRAKVGPVAMLNELNMVYFNMDLRPEDRVFYVNLFDTLSPGQGFVLVNHGHLLLLTRFGLIAGIRYSLVHALYPEAWLEEAGGKGNPNTPNHRIGPILVYTFRTRSQLFRRPQVVLIVNWWINSRYRSGQSIPQAIPYGVLALQFCGDLWTR